MVSQLLVQLDLVGVKVNFVSDDVLQTRLRYPQLLCSASDGRIILFFKKLFCPLNVFFSGHCGRTTSFTLSVIEDASRLFKFGYKSKEREFI